jgi:hypothetical protein
MSPRHAIVVLGALLVFPACDKKEEAAATPAAAAPAEGKPAASGDEHGREHEREHEGDHDGGHEHGEHEPK